MSEHAESQKAMTLLPIPALADGDVIWLQVRDRFPVRGSSASATEWAYKGSRTTTQYYHPPTGQRFNVVAVLDYAWTVYNAPMTFPTLVKIRSHGNTKIEPDESLIIVHPEVSK